MKLISLNLKSLCISLSILAVATVLTRALEPELAGNLLYILLAAVAIAALYCSLPVALLTAFAACLCHSFFFQTPRHSFMVNDRHDVLELLTFGIVAVVVSLFGHRLRTAIEAAEHATRAREEILAIVSHDLRNPLSVIDVNASLMARSSEIQSAACKTSLGLIRKSVGRMSRQIQDLLDFENIRSNRFEVSIQRYPACALLSSVSETMVPLAERKSIQLHVQLDGNDFEVPCDPQRMLQVFDNLIGNAIKFSGSGTQVTLRAECRDNIARFSVEDQGPGIPAEHLPHIFDRYWRAKPTAHLGTGLGLAISRGIVEAHQGTVVAHSQTGMGTTFIVEIPHATARAASSESQSVSA